MKRHVRKVAVLGSGVMGSAIAAHFANAGVPALVLDIVPRELDESESRAGLSLSDRKVRDRIARDSVRAMAKARPSPLFSKERFDLIEIGNLEDDLSRLEEVDWIVEAVREDMSIKKKVFAAITPHIQAGALLSSNTSGLPLTEMAAALPESLRPRFLGTHFFNPPRYMRLLELIPTPDTSREVIDRVTEFAEVRLGKGIVPAKDTPNFIANRIGVHSLMIAMQRIAELGLTFEEVDALTGPAMGRPKTATFRLADLVGIDTLLYVAKNSFELLAHDESRDAFVVPKFLEAMVAKKLLGRKAGAGFYKRVKKPAKAILTLDPNSLEYREPVKPDFPELKKIMREGRPESRLKALIGGEGRAAELAWKLLAPTLSYSAMRLPEIADDARTLDRGLCLGFNWELGPFAAWDALGFRETTERLRADGYPLPTWVDEMYTSGATTFFKSEDGDDPDRIVFDSVRAAGSEIRRNDSASLIDLGDGVLGLEFHSKMNAIDDGTIEMMNAAVDEAEMNWQALVVANDGGNFCAGANLQLLVQHAREGRWEPIESIIRGFQKANDRLEHCAVPVVVAPHGMALGGGCEVVMAGHGIRASAESYVGLVEIGAGVIPAGGGCLRLYKRRIANLPDPTDLYTSVKVAFETIGMAKVSTSAEEARSLGFLRPQDSWSMNRELLVSDAKKLAVGMATTGFTPKLPGKLNVMGRAGIGLIGGGLVNMAEGRFISEHDRKIGGELARILCGGDVGGPVTVSEQHILDLECESFLRLCGETKTQERMIALLETGKPLRN